jgi:hypothetical protein
MAKLVTNLAKLPGGQPQGDWDPDSAAAEASANPADPALAGVAARVRLLMLISGLTTMIAIAAVIGVIGYRVYHSGDSGTGPVAQGIVTLPKSARVVSTAVAGDRIVVTLDVAGATEIRTFDAKTLKEAGRIRFATEP